MSVDQRFRPATPVKPKDVAGAVDLEDTIKKAAAVRTVLGRLEEADVALQRLLDLPMKENIQFHGNLPTIYQEIAHLDIQLCGLIYKFKADVEGRLK